MTLRGLARELRDFPATTMFCMIWLVVFVAMVATQLAEGEPMPALRWLVLGIGGGRRFGDLSLEDLAHGQAWRLVTSTFVHYSVLHLGLNLLAMYQLGTLVESWYGSPQLVWIYGLAGGGGNLVSVLIRHAIGSSPRVHSGGGSVVILGLVGLCAVAGWRARTRLGAMLGRQMAIVLVLTAVLGIALPRFIDNWGHAGGALVGSLLGFRHRALLARISRPSAWGAGVLTGIVIAACGAAQLVDDHREGPGREETRLHRRLSGLGATYRNLSRIARLVHQHADAKVVLGMLDHLDLKPAHDRLRSRDLSKLRGLVETAKARSLSDPELHELDEGLTRLRAQVRREYGAAWKQLGQLRQDPRYRRWERSRLNRLRTR